MRRFSPRTPLGAGSVLAGFVVLLIIGCFTSTSYAQAGGPTVRVRINAFPELTFVPGTSPAQLIVQSGVPLSILWDASPNAPAGAITGARYGWNIRNPSNDEEWEQSWCAPCPPIPVRIFNAGTQRFYLEVEDNLGARTLAQIEIVINQLGVEPTTWTSWKRHLLR